jgi:hypothetical protein
MLENAWYVDAAVVGIRNWQSIAPKALSQRIIVE